MPEPEPSALNDDEREPGLRDAKLTDALKAFETELCGLAPRADRLDRERLMFLAGQASVVDGENRVITPAEQTVGRLSWPAAFGAMTATAAALLVVVVLQHAKITSVESIVRGSDASDEKFALADGTTGDSQRRAFQQRTDVRNQDTLIAADVHFGNIDEWLASEVRSRNGAATDRSEAPLENHQVPTLTPASWRRAIEPERAMGSSSSHPYQNSHSAGVTS